MAINSDELERLIKESIPDAQIVLQDLAGDEDHYSIIIQSGKFKGISKVAKKIGVSDVVNGGGYRSLVNIGENGGQEISHLHFHIFGGEKVGKMVS